MTLTDTTRRTAAAAALGGITMLGLLSAAPAASAADCYSGQTTTDTSLSTTPGAPKPGDTFVADATVTAAGVPVTTGTVTFNYAGQTKSDAVSAGHASATFTAQQGTSSLYASFAAECAYGGAVLGISSSSVPVKPPTVAGVEKLRPRPAAGLAVTGLDGSTQALALVGGALTGAGVITLVLRRRHMSA